ncbi:MAG: hypothetical protein COB15_11730 [Flavobacteriales bacterium]|nr:MAG: hypothetical protein COB15_11730 [Flavobacteriales bacterium]
MIKLKLLIFGISLFFLGSCSLQKDVQVKRLSQEVFKELDSHRELIECEQYINGSMKYKSIEEIEKGKLNKLRREAKRCGCNVVYLDFNNYLGADYEGDFLFSGICVNEKK